MNPHKVDEVSAIMKPYGIDVLHLPLRRVEIQADTLEEVARYSLEVLNTYKPVAVEDSGLFINHFGGFPGPYSHYALETIGLPGIIKLMKGVKERRASFQSCVAFKGEGGIQTFRGVVEGRISEEIRGTQGFGFDPIFIPDEVAGNETFGELDGDTKNRLSHRARSFRAFARWLVGS